MSSSAAALPSPEFTTCARCARLFHPPNPDGCWPCRGAAATRPDLVQDRMSLDQLEREAEANAATYYFLESFFGHPDDP